MPSQWQAAGNLTAIYGLAYPEVPSGIQIFKDKSMSSYVIVKWPLIFHNDMINQKLNVQNFTETHRYQLAISIRFCFCFSFFILQMLLLRLRMPPALSSLLRVVLIFFIKCFFMHLLIWFLSLKLLLWWNILPDVLMLKQPCDPETKPIWSRHSIIPLYYEIWFVTVHLLFWPLSLL